MDAAISVPDKGTEEYEAWLDGPMPEPANGRGQWLGGRSARSRAAKREAVANGVADGGAGQSGDAQSLMAAASGQPAQSVSPTADATEAVLIAIRDDGNAHDSDRIAAMKVLDARAAQARSAQGDGPSPLVALAQALALLAPHERLAWLQGERIAHVQAGTGGVGRSG